MRLKEFAHFLHIISTALHLLIELRVEPIDVIETRHIKVQPQLNVLWQLINVELLVVHKHSQKVLLRIQQCLYVLSFLPARSSAVLVNGGQLQWV